MAFATYTDIATRLEKTLSATEQANATQLCVEATALILDVVDKTEAAVTGNALTVCKGVVIRMVCRSMASPQGLLAASETLGEYSRSETYNRDASMLMLPDERLLVRHAVHGRLTESVMLGSHFQEVE